MDPGYIIHRVAFRYMFNVPNIILKQIPYSNSTYTIINTVHVLLLIQKMEMEYEKWNYGFTNNIYTIFVYPTSFFNKSESNPLKHPRLCIPDSPVYQYSLFQRLFFALFKEHDRLHVEPLLARFAHNPLLQRNELVRLYNGNEFLGERLLRFKGLLVFRELLNVVLEVELLG